MKPIDITAKLNEGTDVTMALIEAKALIADPDDWSEHGYGLAVYGPGGCIGYQTKCAIAAIDCATVLRSDTYERRAIRGDAYAFLQRAVTAITDGETQNIAKFNDTHSHADVMEAFDLAIRMSRG